MNEIKILNNKIYMFADDGVFLIESAQNRARNCFGYQLDITWQQAHDNGSVIGISDDGQPYLQDALEG